MHDYYTKKETYFLSEGRQDLLIAENLAINIGLEESIVLKLLYLLLSEPHKEINGTPYNRITLKQWNRFLPYFTVQKIRSILSRLEVKGLIIIDNFSYHYFDNARWYTINFDVLNQLMEN